MLPSVRELIVKLHFQRTGGAEWRLGASLYVIADRIKHSGTAYVVLLQSLALNHACMSLLLHICSLVDMDLTSQHCKTHS